MGQKVGRNGMRLIDADKLHPDRMTNKGTVAISQSQIAKAPTIEAVPLSVIEKIKAEFEEYEDCEITMEDALEIIDTAVKECDTVASYKQVTSKLQAS